MLGRLARYLRMVGLDTAYETGLDDEEVLRRSTAEGRFVITRDRGLALRARGSVLIIGVQIEQQWRELKGRFPALPEAPRFERCTLCNGRLLELSGTDRGSRDPAVPDRIWQSGQSLYRCETCAHVYWEGSHTDSVRRRLARWSAGVLP
jgi:uncharacterized protein